MCRFSTFHTKCVTEQKTMQRPKQLQQRRINDQVMTTNNINKTNTNRNRVN